MLLLSMGSVSTGVDAVDVLGMIQSTLVSIDDSTTDCSTQQLILRALPRLFSFLEIPSLLFAASVFLLGVSRPFSTFAVKITNELTQYVIEMHAGCMLGLACDCGRMYMQSNMAVCWRGEHEPARDRNRR